MPFYILSAKYKLLVGGMTSWNWGLADIVEKAASIPRPGVHVLFWCPRRMAESRADNRPVTWWWWWTLILPVQLVSCNRGDMGVGRLCQAHKQLEMWPAVNIECARLFVCFLWGPRHRGAVGATVNRYLTFRRCAGGGCHLAQAASQDCFRRDDKTISAAIGTAAAFGKMVPLAPEWMELFVGWMLTAHLPQEGPEPIPRSCLASGSLSSCQSCKMWSVPSI